MPPNYLPSVADRWFPLGGLFVSVVFICFLLFSYSCLIGMWYEIMFNLYFN